jgi:hypothetical protein
VIFRKIDRLDFLDGRSFGLLLRRAYRSEGHVESVLNSDKPNAVIAIDRISNLKPMLPVA